MANISVMRRLEPTEVSAQFVIYDFVRDMTNAKPEECFKSNAFLAGADNVFWLMLFPNGRNENHEVFLIQNTMDTAVNLHQNANDWNREFCIISFMI